MNNKRAVFLDRDGVLNKNREDYVKTWDEVEFLPGVFHALRKLAESDFLVFVLTNQSAVGRGLLSIVDLESIHMRMKTTIESQAGRIDGFYYCPHRPDENCSCRKPAPGLLLAAAVEHDLILEESYFVGDARSDMEAALNAGCQPVLVLSGRGAAQLPTIKGHLRSACKIASDLPEAVHWILQANQL
jgi:D-glycero-D-manno-heptose 1,7-bisphosphate phosphatase